MRRIGSSTRRFQVTVRLAQHKCDSKPLYFKAGSNTSGIQVNADWLVLKAIPDHNAQQQVCQHVGVGFTEVQTIHAELKYTYAKTNIKLQIPLFWP
jgi:hypothetical protein